MSASTESPVSLQSTIRRAIVYADAARVERVVLAKLQPGLNQLALAHLPRSLDLNSLRVTTTAGELRFVDSRFLAKGSEEIGGREQSASVIALTKKVQTLVGQQEGLSAELGLIDRVEPTVGESLEAPLRPLTFARGLDLLTARRRQAQQRLRALEIEIDQATRELILARQLDKPETRSQEVVVVGLFAPEATDSELVLSYEAGQAGWQPQYSLRLDPMTNTVELTASADVWQQTEETWTDVALKLSTSEPEPQLVLPKPRPWILESVKTYKDDASELYRSSNAPMAKKMRRSAPPPPGAPAPQMAVASMDAMPMDKELAEEAVALGGGGGPEDTKPGYVPGMAVGDRPAPMLRSEMPQKPPPPAPQRRPEPSVRDLAAGLDFEVEVVHAVSCRSHGERVRVGMGVFTYPAEMQYTLRPALKDHAFSKAVVQHTGDTPLLAGPGSVFIEDAFAGAVRVETTAPGGEMELQLGPEMRIKCVRNSRTSVHREGLITREDVHKVEVELQIESHLDHAAKLIIEDQVPISTDAKVKVRLLETTPRSARLDDKTGVVRAEVTIGPKERIEIGFVYQIEVPRDAQIERKLGDQV